MGFCRKKTKSLNNIIIWRFSSFSLRRPLNRINHWIDVVELYRFLSVSCNILTPTARCRRRRRRTEERARPRNSLSLSPQPLRYARLAYSVFFPNNFFLDYERTGDGRAPSYSTRSFRFFCYFISANRFWSRKAGRNRRRRDKIKTTPSQLPCITITGVNKYFITSSTTISLQDASILL